ncbi:MAG: hypothetical protein IJN43_12320 [Ruminococcus sp.]|nr:hypothetical protein [Ruminococcus sp.]
MGKEKKSSSGFGFAAVIAAGALLLSQKSCGTEIGIGREGLTGTDTGVVVQATNPNNSQAETPEITSPQQITVEITIDGRDYICNNKKMTLNELMAELNSVDTSAEIYITCESSATVNAKESLDAELQSKGFYNIIYKS